MSNACLILLSGLPCTGKSTWRDRFLRSFDDTITIFRGVMHRKVTIISSDDISFELCDTLNASLPTPACEYTYANIWDTKGDEIERLCWERLRLAAARGDIIIVDRTLLTTARRINVLQQADGMYRTDKVFCVSFVVTDAALHQHTLQTRNASQSKKQITEEIMTVIRRQVVTVPTSASEEGFAEVFVCPSVLEAGWEAAHASSVQIIVDRITNETQLVMAHKIINNDVNSV